MGRIVVEGTDTAVGWFAIIAAGVVGLPALIACRRRPADDPEDEGTAPRWPHVELTRIGPAASH